MEPSISPVEAGPRRAEGIGQFPSRKESQSHSGVRHFLAGRSPVESILTLLTVLVLIGWVWPAERGFGSVAPEGSPAANAPTQGEYAVTLAERLNLGERMPPDEAVSALTELGIEPTGGWQPDEQMDARALGEIRKAAEEAAKRGAISMEQAIEILRYGPAEQLAEWSLQQLEEPEVGVVRPPEEAMEEEEEPSAIERLLSGEIPGVVSKELKQFGYEVFRKPISTFAPVTNVPVGPDYVIGPGDRFTVTLWGRISAQYPVTVNRSGEITIPEVGVLKVWGMTFGRLQEYLQHEFSRKHTDFKMAVAMDRLRTIRVYVVGEAQTPGSYSLSSLSTVINALFAAGGPSKNGTMRDIRLLRDQGTAVTIDLYDFLLGGDKSKDVRLQDGDTVFIPLIGSVVGVAGNVKRPAIYEMAEPMSLAQVLQLAGGITHAGWLQRVQVERVDRHDKRIVVDFDITEKDDLGEGKLASDILVQDGDVVKVFAVSPLEQNVVYLEGHVLRPGKYELKLGMKLTDILTSYQVLQPQPNLEYAEIERLVEPDLHPTVIPFNLSKLLAGDESENIELARYDTIRVFRWDERVSRRISVSGLVFRPGEYRLTPGMRVKDLVDTAGGLQKNAYLKTAEITRRRISQLGMQTDQIDIDLGAALAGDREHNIALRDYDHLVIRPIPELAFDRTATISGEVKFPGTYPIRRGETLSSLIERAGGYTERAYVKGAVFTRDSAKVIQQQRMDELVRQIEETVLVGADRAMGGALDEETARTYELRLKAKRELLSKLRAARIDGRVVIRLASLDEFRGSKYDLELERGDTLDIPEIPGVVNIVGEVFNPTALLCEEGKSVSYYLRRVGGVTAEADKKQLSVIRADGSVVSIAQKDAGRIDWDGETNQWVFGGFMSIKLYPGDTIVVPRKMDRFFWLKTTKDVTQILFNVALAAGVVLAL
jgi:polysaccharide export outer membrane protein